MAPVTAATDRRMPADVEINAWMRAVAEAADRPAFAAPFRHFAPRIKGFLVRGGTQQPADAHLTLVELLHAAQRERSVHQALSELPPEQAEVLRLSFFEERPHGRIAPDLGIPLGTVKSRIRLAVTQLRRILERHRA
jgi:RNA polymerase sigma factor (sigma-70 family)